MSRLTTLALLDKNVFTIDFPIKPDPPKQKFFSFLNISFYHTSLRIF